MLKIKKGQTIPTDDDQPKEASRNVIVHHGMHVESIILHEVQHISNNLMPVHNEANDSAVLLIDIIPEKILMFLLHQMHQTIGQSIKVDSTMTGLHFSPFLRQIMI